MEGGASRRPRRWGLGDAFVGYVVAFFLTALVASTWVEVTGEDESLGFHLAPLAGLWTGLVGTLLVASRRKGEGRLSDDFGLRVGPSDLGVGLVAGLASQFLLVPLLYLPFRAFGDDPDVSREARELIGRAGGWGVALLAAALVVGAPLVEELFFRGLLLRSLERRFGARWAVGGSALAFGVTHFQLLQLPGLVAFGLVLAVLVQRYGRLGPALVAHAAFNAATVTVVLVHL